MFNILTKNDPVYHCKMYKDKGCSHVDGILCDFKTCTIKLEYELFELEQELDIPINLRFYKNERTTIR